MQTDAPTLAETIDAPNDQPRLHQGIVLLGEEAEPGRLELDALLNLLAQIIRRASTGDEDD